MRIVISTPWMPQGLTILSAYLKQSLESHGHSVGLHAWRGKCQPIGHPDDRHVFRGEFKSAAKDADVVIWPEVVEPDQVAWCRSSGIKSVWIPMWEYVGRESAKDRDAYDAIVCPTQCCYELLESLDADNAHHCQWFLDFPTQRPRPTPTAPVFYHSVRGVPGDLRNTSAVLKAFAQYRRDGGTSTLRIKTLKPLKHFCESGAIDAAGSGLEVIEGRLDYEEVRDLYTSADLFVYPSKREGLCLVILEALSNSVPVLTLDAPPMNEWVRHGINGRLSASRQGKRWGLIHERVADTAAITSAMHYLSQRAVLDNLKAGCFDGRAERAARFGTFWDRLLGDLRGNVTTSPSAASKPIRPRATPKRDMPTTDLLMVTHNRIEYTQETLRSIGEHTPTPHRWIIADNGSADGTVEWLRSRRWHVPAWLIANHENIGKAAAMNQALRLSGELDNPSPFLCFVDNDICVPDNWLGTMIDLQIAFPCLGATSLCFDADRYPIAPGPINRRMRLREFGSLSGAALLFHRSVHDRIGYCDEDFGKYGLFDAEWCFRIRLLSLKMAHPEMPGKHLGADGESGEYVEAKAAAMRRAYQLWQTRTHEYKSGRRPLRIGGPLEVPPFEVLNPPLEQKEDRECESFVRLAT